MTAKNLVTILINNYNYDGFLAAAIDSALNQTYSNIEVIVVDDGSNDNSPLIIKSYGDKIVPIIKANGGQASAFNVGFEKSKGNIICFLDADDVFLAEKVEKIVDIFEKHQDIGWCFHPLKLVNANCEETDVQVYPGLSGVYDVTSHIRRGKLHTKLPFKGTATSGICFSRSLLEKILPMPEEIRITSDDYIKFAAFGLSKGFVLLQELALQRIHGSNTFTLRAEKKQLRAEVYILTAYWLKANFPYLSPFVNKIFAWGLASDSSTEGGNVRLQKIIAEYTNSLTLFEKLGISFRTKLYSFSK